MPRLYDVHNPTKGKRVFYDGIDGSQREIAILAGGSARVLLADHIARQLQDTPNDLTLFLAPDTPPVATPEPPVETKPKPICHVIGHRGIGDNIHQRGPIRELMKQYDVYLETPAWMIYHDLVAQGLKLIFMPTHLHAQKKQILREHGTYQWHRRPSHMVASKRIYYNQPEVKHYGSITQAMFGVLGLPVPEQPDFSLPVPQAWRDKARGRIASWNVGSRPLLVYRPVTVRREWNGTARNPDIAAYHTLMDGIRQRFFVASIADLQHGTEDIVGREQNADVKIHRGELHFDELAGLWAEADLIFANAGFGPVLAQAVGTPCITIYGGRESYKTTERAGAHLAPTLGIDPDMPCDCHSHAMRCGRCKKHITLPPATDRINRFIAQFVKPREVMQDNGVSANDKTQPASIATPSVPAETSTLIFGTFYVDSEDRRNLTELWKRVHLTLNPDCDFLAVDSQSPMKMFEDWTPYDGQRHRQMYFNFTDNIGHLSRKDVTGAKDGWGRAFTKGLELAGALGYSHVAHIEGDSLFRIKVKPEIERMARENAKCFSTEVIGMRIPGSNRGWVETGLMLFSADYVKQSDFIKRYDWPNRRSAPTPEIIVRNLLGNDLVMQSHWKVLRADKNQITSDNIASLNLDWVTHQHKSEQQDVYRKFAAMALGEEIAGSGATTNAPEPPAAASAAPPLLKLNLGCGSNRLGGWTNHDKDIDITKTLPWGDASAKFIFIEHCVEHVGHKKAIAFFKEAHRALAPGGILRVCVPSLEKIRESNDDSYYRFTTKWQKTGPTKRGAMEAIIFAHGHEMIWCGALLESVLYFCGFDDIKQAAAGQSEHAELRGVEGHGKVIGERFNNLESCVFEATKQGQITTRDLIAAPPPGIAPPDVIPVIAATGRKVAIVVGGADNWADDFERAKWFCTTYGCAPEIFYINDHIGTFRDGVAVTLHPDKIAAWLQQRRADRLPDPSEIWGHKPSPGRGVTHWTDDWRGSSGLFAIAVAMKKGHDRVILAGVPMESTANHFIRHQKWLACPAFLPGWKQKQTVLAPIVRSLSGGWTQQTFGEPDAAWLGVETERKVA
jgi:ADP-heptose:LPS heptosyltransferase